MDGTGNVQQKSEGDLDGSSHLTPSSAVDIPGKMYSTDSDLSDWEIRQFGRHKITSPPLIHKNQSSDNDENIPPGSPGKRSYEKTFDTPSFETATENVQLSPNKKKHKEQVWTPGNGNQGQMPKNWNNSVSSRDSALGSSLFSAFGSVLTDSSTSFDSQSNSDDTTSSVNSSPVHSVYGRYQKIYTNDKGKNTEDKNLREFENLLLHRLPGENLGMILGIEGGKFNETISGVFVKTVTIGGAAYRATGSSKGIAVGDEILEVNGMDLKQMNRDECMTVLKEMPLRVNLMVRRGSKFSGPTSSDGVSHFRQKMKEVSSREMKVCKDQRFMQNYAMTTTTSESEDDYLEGFALYRIEVDKNPEESLGISIVPSYGSTREFYQVKRLLPSGAAARSTKLRVGDRLVSCNGVSLRNLAQAKCLSILKTEAQHGDLELEVLRQAENDTPMEISVIVANGLGSKESKVSSSSQQEIYPNSGLESESDNDVVLSGFHLNRQERSPDSVNQVFAQNVKLQNRAPTKHPPQRQPSESNVSDQDSDYSLKSQHQKLIKAKMESNSSDPWSMALPPPAEFSDDAGLTSEAGDTGDEQVPTTNIDDILSDYAPSISGPASPRIEPVKRDLQSVGVSSGLDRSPERKKVNPLTQIQESPQEMDYSAQNGIENKPPQVQPQRNSDRDLLDVPDKSMNGYDTLREQRQVMDVFDSYLTSEDDSFVSHKQSDLESSSNSNVYIQSSPQSKPRNIPCESDSQPFNNGGTTDDTKLGKNVVTESDDDHNIVPVQVKRDISVPNWAKYSISSDIPASVFDLPESSVDEDVIMPASVQREKKASLYEKPKPHHDTSPPRVKIPPRPKPQPRKSKSSESEESMEEMVSPVLVKKEQSSKVLIEKIGTNDIEETFIVPEKAKRENSWSGVQMVLMANKWAKSSNKEQDSGLLNVISNLKSDKSEPSKPEANSVTVTPVNQVSVTPVYNEQITPVDNAQRISPVQSENVVSISVESSQGRQSSEEDSTMTEHITPRIDEFADEYDNEDISLTIVHDKIPDKSLSETNQPTHKTVVCVSDDIKDNVCIDSESNLPLAHTNSVTLENTVLMDTNIGGKQVSEPTSPETSPSVSPRSPVMESRSPLQRSPQARSPVSREDMSPDRNSPSLSPRATSPGSKLPSLSPRAMSPGTKSPSLSPRATSPGTKSPSLSPRAVSPESKSPSLSPRAVSPGRTSPTPSPRAAAPGRRSPSPSPRAISPGRKSPSLSPRAVSPRGVTLSVDPVKDSEASTTKTSLVKSPVASPRSSVSSYVSEGEDKDQATSKPEKSAPKQPTKYTTSVAVTKPSLLSTIRTQKTTPGQMKPLSTIKPLKINTSFQPKPVKYSTTINTKPSLLSTLHGSALSSNSSTDAKSSRSEEEPFQVNVLKGILGLGMKVKVTAEGHTQVTEVQSTGPIAKDKNIRTGDYILAINNTELSGLHDSKVQQILRLLPRGLAKIVASATPPSGENNNPSGDSGPANQPEVNTAKSTKLIASKVSPQIPVKPSGPKVTPRTIVTTSEPTQPISTPTLVSVVTDSVVPTVSNKLQTTIITNSHDMAKPDVPKPLPRDDVAKSTEVPPKPVPRADIPKSVSQEEVQKPTPREDAGKSSSTEAMVTSDSSTRKAPPPIAPKPRMDKPSKSEPVAANRHSMGGYVGSAAGKVKAYERSSVTEVGSSYTAPSNSVVSKKNVSPTEKANKDTDPSGPIDTVIFSSIGGSKTSPPRSGHGDQEPRLIPSGHVDYVSSTKAKSSYESSPPRQIPSGPISPKLASPTEKDASLKISPRKVNSALSPRKNKEPSQFNMLTKSSVRPGKNDDSQSDTSAPDIDIVTPQSAPNIVESSPIVSVDADVSVVDKVHDKSEVNVVDVLHAATDGLPETDQQEKQEVVDQASQEVVCTMVPVPESVETGEGKTPMLGASVEVLHEDNATKLTDSSLPNNTQDDSFDQTDHVCERADSEADNEDKCPPLPPQSTMPVALSIAKDMIDDLLDEVGDEEPSQSLPAVPTTIAKEMLRDKEFQQDSSEDLPPSLPPSLPPPIPSSIPPLDLLTESSVDDIVDVVPDSVGVVNDDVLLVDLPGDVNTNTTVDGADCMPESKDLLLSGVSPSACKDIPVDSQTQGRMPTDSSNTSYDSVFFQQDSPGLRDRPGERREKDVNNDENIVINDVHKESSNLSNMDNTLDSADMAFCDDNAENQRKGDNSLFQENLTDSFKDVSFGNSARSAIKSVGTPDSFSDNDSLHVRSKRRWSLITGPQELNVAYLKGSFSSDTTIDESIMSSENLANLLDSANNVMDQTGLSLDDEIVVIILYRHDPMMSIGVRLTVGQNQEAVVSSVDSDSLAGKDGRIVAGDVLLSANGESVTAGQMEEVMDNLNNTNSSHVVLVVSKSDRLNMSEFVDAANPCEQVVPDPEQEIRNAVVPDDLGNDDQIESKDMDVKMSEVIVVDPATEVNDLTPPEIDSLPPPQIPTSPPPQITSLPPTEVQSLPPPEIDLSQSLEVPTSSPPKISTSPPPEVITSPPPDVATSPPLEVATSLQPEVTTSSTPEVPISPPPKVRSSPPPKVTVPPEVTTILPPEVATAPQPKVKTTKREPFTYEMPVFDDPIDDADKEEFDVIMTKGVTGLGFLIEGGKASPRGDMPLTIRRIIKNGPAEKCGQLKVKDEIREVNGEDITQMRHSEAWQHLKFLDEGEVRIKIWRRKVEL